MNTTEQIFVACKHFIDTTMLEYVPGEPRAHLIANTAWKNDFGFWFADITLFGIENNRMFHINSWVWNNADTDDGDWVGEYTEYPEETANQMMTRLAANPAAWEELHD